MRPRPDRFSREGFTLLELMMAIMILAIMTLLSFFCFDAAMQSWRAGIEMSDSMAQADYVMNQVESALRSAYFSPAVKKDGEKGLNFTDGGEGEGARDVIEFMKLGRAFVGRLKAVDGKTEIAEMPHRVRLYVEDETDGGGGGLMAKAWSNDFRDPDKFDVEEDVKAFCVSPRVIGMNCRVLKKPPASDAKEVEWKDEWTSSNALPYKVSVTLYLRPVKEGEEPVAVSRDVEIPVWRYSQNPSIASKKKGKSGKGGRGGTSSRAGRPMRPVQPGGWGVRPPGGAPVQPGGWRPAGPGGGGPR